MNVKLNYTFQPSDPRDFKFKATTALKSSLLIPQIRILNQEDLGSCVSNAVALYIYIATKGGVIMSRLFHYYCGRLLEEVSQLEDTGLTIRNACKIISKIGVCKENVYPYNTALFAKMPPISAFQQCKMFRQYTYAFLVNPAIDIKTYLNLKKLPVLFGALVYDSFMNTSSDGKVSIPDTNKEQLLGGHCMLIVGYNDDTQLYTIANSWGTSWGDKGFCYIPYEYIHNSLLAWDFTVFTFIY